MFKKLTVIMLVGFISLMIADLAFAAPPEPQKFHLDVIGEMEVGKVGYPTYPGLDSGLLKITKNSDMIEFQTCTPNCVPFTLKNFWREVTYANGELGSNCFPPYEGQANVEGAIHIHRERNGNAKAIFWFRAIYEPTGQEVKYMLTLTGKQWDDNFPPTGLYDDALMVATNWKMETEGKGKHNNPSSGACKGGPVVFEDPGVTLLVTRIE